MGYQPEDLVGLKHFYDLHPGDGFEEFKSLEFKMMEEKKLILGLKNPILAKDGRIVWVATNAFPIVDAEGALQGYRGTDTDITERISLETQLQQAQKMEAIGSLTGGIAHDFNNSLYAVLGFSEFILEGLDAQSPLRADVKQIIQAAQHAANITKQLLAFSRRQIIQPCPTDIDSLILDLKKMLHRLLGEDLNISYKLNVGQELANVDTSQVQQVLINLCVNARDAMPEGGPLAIETRVIHAPHLPRHPKIHPGTSFIRISVTDGGTGMPPDVVTRIFEPFFTTKALGKGTGLGLSVVLGIIEQHGGWIDVESQPGRGTRFDVHLPCAEVSIDSETGKTTSIHHGNGELILLVEDAEPVREIAGSRLRSLGYRVIDAGGIESGWQAFLASPEPIRCLISDVVLPDGTGVTLAERITAAAPPVHIILSSGYADERSRIEEIQNHGWTFLAKPHSKAELSTVLHDLLRGSK